MLPAWRGMNIQKHTKDETLEMRSERAEDKDEDEDAKNEEEQPTENRYEDVLSNSLWYWY